MSPTFLKDSVSITETKEKEEKEEKEGEKKVNLNEVTIVSPVKTFYTDIRHQKMQTHILFFIKSP